MGKPDFVNDKGTEFYIEETLNKYAIEKLGKKARVYYVKAKDGYEAYLLVENNEPVDESYSLESMAYKIDAFSILRRDS